MSKYVNIYDYECVNDEENIYLIHTSIQQGEDYEIDYVVIASMDKNGEVWLKEKMFKKMEVDENGEECGFEVDLEEELGLWMIGYLENEIEQFLTYLLGRDSHDNL